MELFPIFFTARRSVSLSPRAAGCEKFAFDLDRWEPKPLDHVKLGEVDTEALIKPILDKFVEQHEVLRIKHDSRRVAVMESDLFVIFEHVRPQLQSSKIRSRAALNLRASLVLSGPPPRSTELDVGTTASCVLGTDVILQ